MRRITNKSFHDRYRVLSLDSTSRTVWHWPPEEMPPVSDVLVNQEAAASRILERRLLDVGGWCRPGRGNARASIEGHFPRGCPGLQSRVPKRTTIDVARSWRGELQDRMPPAVKHCFSRGICSPAAGRGSGRSMGRSRLPGRNASSVQNVLFYCAHYKNVASSD